MCPDFDFCEGCENDFHSGHQPHDENHVFLRMHRPLGTPISPTTILLEDLKILTSKLGIYQPVGISKDAILATAEYLVHCDNLDGQLAALHLLCQLSARGPQECVQAVFSELPSFSEFLTTQLRGGADPVLHSAVCSFACWVAQSDPERAGRHIASIAGNCIEHAFQASSLPSLRTGLDLMLCSGGSVLSLCPQIQQMLTAALNNDSQHGDLLAIWDLLLRALVQGAVPQGSLSCGITRDVIHLDSLAAALTMNVAASFAEFLEFAGHGGKNFSILLLSTLTDSEVFAMSSCRLWQTALGCVGNQLNHADSFPFVGLQVLQNVISGLRCEADSLSTYVDVCTTAIVRCKHFDDSGCGTLVDYVLDFVRQHVPSVSLHKLNIRTIPNVSQPERLALKLLKFLHAAGAKSEHFGTMLYDSMVRQEATETIPWLALVLGLFQATSLDQSRFEWALAMQLSFFVRSVSHGEPNGLQRLPLNKWIQVVEQDSAIQRLTEQSRSLEGQVKWVDTTPF
jgi:hypothetical protein